MTSAVREHAEELRGRVKGPVYRPADAGYRSEAAGFNTAVVHEPALVVAAASATDVREAVLFARRHGYPVSVQATGHGAHAPIDSGVLISTRRLDDVSVHASTRTATIGGGARWKAVVAASAEHGLAPITGSSTNVGVVGYILGGGVGPLARSHGFSSDYLAGLTVVTGAGDLLETSADEHAELFWALRGGKFGFGIVTEVRLKLVELRTLYAGTLFFDEARIETAFRTWVDWTARADPRVTTSPSIVKYPAIDAVPEPLRGRRLLALRFAYPGPREEGERLASPLRSAAPLHLDSLSELPAAEVARIYNDPTEPGPSVVAGMLLGPIDQRFATELLSFVGAGTEGPFTGVELRHLGEAARRDVAAGSAVGGRASDFTLGYVCTDPKLFDTELPRTVTRLTARLKPWISPETNVNWLGKPRSMEHFASAWSPDVFARLTAIAHRYDPDGLLAPKVRRG